MTADEAFPIVKRVVYARARSFPAHVDRDDLVMAAMVRVIGRLPVIDRTRNPEAFIARHAIGAMLDFLRDEKFGARGGAAIPMLSLDAPIPRADHITGTILETLLAPDDPASEAIARVAVDQALDALDGRTRWAVHLHFIQDVEMTEIAGLLGVTASRVSQIISRGLAKMRTVMA